ncbi:MAG: LysR family transcriptional regulator [Actinomycetota bacterium]
MTPTQLRTYSTVVREGSVRQAAATLGVTEAAVSYNVGALRKEFDDRLFYRSEKGLVFTPGGLRLAQRSFELLGLQAQTRREVIEAGQGHRSLRIAATSLFAEYAAPGLIDFLSTAAGDLQVELVVHPLERFAELLSTHAVDVAIGPKSASTLSASIRETPFLRYELIAATTLDLADAKLEKQTWLLGPSAVEPAGVSQFILERVGVPETNQRIYPSHAAALEEVREGAGIALVPSFAVERGLASEALVRVDDARCRAPGCWTAFTPEADRTSPAAADLMRLIETPRAIRAMLEGSGTTVGHFRPSVHITLWS